MEITPIAHIYTDFPTKFGLPRQSGLVKGLRGRIIFEPYYRDPEGVKGLADYNYIWLLWDFSLNHREGWSATSRPPRLGGKKHVGVWATRSPFRPNSIGMSSVHLDSIEYTDKGPVLHVSGIDMMDGTPIYDIKPYIRFDCHTDYTDSFVGRTERRNLTVEDPDKIIAGCELDDGRKAALYEVLAQDPRPQYDADSTGKRRYGFYYDDYDVRFIVVGDVLRVTEIVKVV